MALSGALPSFFLAQDIFSPSKNSKQKSIKARQDFHGTISKVKKHRSSAEINESIDDNTESKRTIDSTAVTKKIIDSTKATKKTIDSNAVKEIIDKPNEGA
jgi:hypothetical protein